MIWLNQQSAQNLGKREIVIILEAVIYKLVLRYIGSCTIIEVEYFFHVSILLELYSNAVFKILDSLNSYKKIMSKLEPCAVAHPTPS